MSKKSAGRTERLISLKDIAAIAKLAVGGVVVWTVPQRFWLPISRLVARVATGMKPARTRRVADRVKAVVGGRLARHPKEVVREGAALGFIHGL